MGLPLPSSLSRIPVRSGCGLHRLPGWNVEAEWGTREGKCGALSREVDVAFVLFY